MLVRRLEIDQMRRKAAELPVDMEVGESDIEILTTVCGRKGVLVRRGTIVLHSALEAEKTARILRETERALALSSYLQRGQLALQASGQATGVIGPLMVAIDHVAKPCIPGAPLAAGRRRFGHVA